MGYCTITYLSTLLPRSVTIGDSTLTTPTINKPKADVIPTNTALRNIGLATQYIDARLRQMYVCPLKRINTLEMNLTASATAGNNYIMVYDAGHFNLDSIIRITDAISTETYTVNTIYDSDLHKVGITPVLTRTYSVAGTVVNLLEYPDPIPTITAQITIGLIFDKLFVSEQQADISNYGKAQRSQGGNLLDDVLAGMIRLEGQDQTGRRFCRLSLRDTQSTTVEIQHGRDKEG